MKKEPMNLEALKKEAARRMKGLPAGTVIDTILRPMLKEFLESMLEGEMDAHMEQERSEGNRRNGKFQDHMCPSPTFAAMARRNKVVTDVLILEVAAEGKSFAHIADIRGLSQLRLARP